MRLGNKGSKTLETRRIALAALNATPGARMAVEEVVLRGWGVEADTRSENVELYVSVRAALCFLAAKGLARDHMPPGYLKKWWSVTQAGSELMLAELASMEVEAEMFLAKLPVSNGPQMK